MADNRRDQSSYASDDNWDKNQRRYVDDNNYSQRSNYNRNSMDLDKDGNIGATGGFYGGTNYMGAGSTFNDYNQDWNNQNRRREHDRNFEEYQGYGYQGKSDYNQNYQHQYGNAGNQQYRSGQNYNRENEHRRQDYNQQYNDYDDRRQWQSDRFKTSNQHRNQEHPLYYGHVGGFRARDDYKGQNQGSDYNSRNRGWSDFENRNRQHNYGSINRNHDRGRNDERSWWDKTRDEVSSWFGDEDAERRRRQDERKSGEHKGKGPREYRRSDERIREDVCDRLSDDSYIDASEIEVQVSNGEVILNGTIDNRNAKRRAEDIIESIAGVSNVQNNLRVGQSMPASNTNYKSTSINVSNRRTDEDLKNR